MEAAWNCYAPRRTAYAPRAWRAPDPAVHSPLPPLRSTVRRSAGPSAPSKTPVQIGIDVLVSTVQTLCPPAAGSAVSAAADGDVSPAAMPVPRVGSAGRPGLDLKHGVRSVTGCLWGTAQRERPERAGRPLTRRIGAIRGLGRRYRTSTSEPQVISAPPKTTLKSAGSPKSRMDRKMVRATLSLSMGATLDTSPICSALK